MSESGKRKRVIVSFETRLKVLKRLDNGESVKKLCDEFNVGKSTINDWRRNKRSIEDICSKIENKKVLAIRCTNKKPVCDIVDEAVWMWFLQERRRGTPISGPILIQKALLIHSKIENAPAFSASLGWLDRWKKRHGIRFAHISGEKMSANESAAGEFKTRFMEMINGDDLLPEQVYNMDETGLNFKMLPNKTFVSSLETSSAPGFKKNKERITIGVCSNAAGTHKIPLFVIGKSAKPRAFKNLNISSLPVYYRSQKSAWMNSSLFEDWFKSEFVPKVKAHLKNKNLPMKAVLLLDNAPTHPHLPDVDGIKIILLPPNVTSLVQPMDQGVIESLKRRYRRKFLSEILLRCEDENLPLLEKVKKINIKDVIFMLASAFREMSSGTIVKSWRKIWPDIENLMQNNDLENEEIETQDILHDLQSLLGENQMQFEDVEKWIAKSDKELENEFFTDEEIIDIASKDDCGCEDDGDNADVEDLQKIGHEEAKRAAEILLQYVEQQQDSTALDMMNIRKWRDLAFRNSLKSKQKQTQITDFFKQ